MEAISKLPTTIGSNKENSPRHNPKKCFKNIAAKDLKQKYEIMCLEEIQEHE
jgi:hypothetical protein